jgi:phospholipid/cholesterol/gamma-HCH transport system substrate-binding protein
MTLTRTRTPTLVATAALITAVVVTVVLVTGAGTGDYLVRAQFRDGGQLVKGNTVQVGGRPVGEVTAIELTRNGLADVVLRIDDDKVRPLHRGTRAAIGTIGLSGVANRHVELVPGPPTTPEIPANGVIPLEHTRGVVDLDTLLNTMDERARADMRGIVEDFAVALTPRTAEQVNGGLQMLNPAVSRLTALGREITRDQAALKGLLRHAASVGSVLARRRGELGTGLRATAGTLTAIASERDALGRAVEGAPEALRTGTRTLRRVREQTLPAVEPFLRAARPTIRPLDQLLAEVQPTLNDSLPLISRMRGLMPDARAAMEPLPELARAAMPALRSGIKAQKDVRPMISGLRPYAPDLVAGQFLGFGGSTAGYYDANGHYARIQLQVGPGGLLGLSPRPEGERMEGYRTGIDKRCPGAAEEPAPDKSNPWHEGGKGACDPADDHG